MINVFKLKGIKMILRKVKCYILKKRLNKRAREWNIEIPSHWEKKLFFYEKKYKIRLNCFNSDDYLIMSTSLSNKPLFNLEWAAHIILIDKPEILIAFEMTLGHERTHEPFKPCIKNVRCRKDMIFIRWVNEVHADFGSCAKIPYLTRIDMVNSMKYKRKIKLKAGKKDKDARTHPSWKRRIDYAKNYDYNEALIKKIAQDVGCQNTTLINELTNLWPDIYPN